MPLPRGGSLSPGGAPGLAAGELLAAERVVERPRECLTSRLSAEIIPAGLGSPAEPRDFDAQRMVSFGLAASGCR